MSMKMSNLKAKDFADVVLATMVAAINTWTAARGEQTFVAVEVGNNGTTYWAVVFFTE